MDDYENAYFKKKYLTINISSRVSLFCHFISTKIFAGKHLPPSSEIFVQKIPIQNSLLFVNRFIFTCCTCCDKLIANWLIIPRQYFIYILPYIIRH